MKVRYSEGVTGSVRVSINIKLFVSHLIDSYIYVRNIEPSEYRPITLHSWSAALSSEYLGQILCGIEVNITKMACLCAPFWLRLLNALTYKAHFR